MKVLAADAHRKEIVETVKNNQVTVVTGPTGCGKSTKIPLFLLEEGMADKGTIVVLQPRRVSAVSLGQWVAKLAGSRVGDRIGYQVGGDRQTSSQTQLVYMTVGSFLGLIGRDRSLSRFSTVIMDEYHERNVNQDTVLALLDPVLKLRPEFRLLVMSATSDAQADSEYFRDAPIIRLEGRQFEIETVYTQKEQFGNKRKVRWCAERALELLNPPTSGLEIGVDQEGHPIRLPREACLQGDILVFMPDQETIAQTISLLQGWLKSEAKHLIPVTRLLALYGQQGEEDQAKAFEIVEGTRRVIIATPIAETSITIEGVVHVVDSGLVKMEISQGPSMSSLQVTEHSKSGCDQRAGRSGRTQKGICHRAYTFEEYLDRPDFTEPEIMRMGHNRVLLMLRCMEFTFEQVLEMAFRNRPLEEQWRDSELRLKVLEALDRDGNVTPDGRRMNALRAEPMMTRMVLNAVKRGCLEPVLIIAAALAATKSIFVRPRDNADKADAAHRAFVVRDSDPMTQLKVYQAWIESGEDRKWAHEHFLSSRALEQVTRLVAQFRETLVRDNGKLPDTTDTTEETIAKVVASGLIVNLAVRSTRFEYEWRNMTTFIFPGSAAFGHSPPQHVCCVKVLGSQGEKGTKMYLRGVQVIEPTWLEELVPAHMCERRLVISRFYDTSFRIEYEFNGIQLSSEPLEVLDSTNLLHVADRMLEQIEKPWTEGLIHSDLYVMHANWHSAIKMLKCQNGSDRYATMRAVAREKILTQLAGVHETNRFSTTSFALALEDLLTTEEFAQHQAEHREEIERQRVSAELQAQWRREEETRRAMIQEAEEAIRAPLRPVVADLDERLRKIGVHHVPYSGRSNSNYYIQSRGRDAVRFGSIFVNRDQAVDAVEAYRELVEDEEIKAAEKIAKTAEMYRLVLGQFPVCPVCGGNWDEQYRCSSPHNRNRLVPLRDRSQTQGLIGRFVTNNKGELFAKLEMTSDGVVRIRFEIESDCAWTGRVFKHIEYVAHQSVLPAHLADSAEEIQDMLGLLEMEREAVARIAREIEEQRRAITSGEVAVLTFTETDKSGFLKASHGGTTCVAVYDPNVPYPARGQRWICRLVAKKGMMTSSVDAFPMRKLEGTSMPEDVTRFAAEIAKAYEGLPSDLLQ